MSVIQMRCQPQHDIGKLFTFDSVTGKPQDRSGVLLPEFAYTVGQRPILSSAGKDWRGVALERFQTSNFNVDLGPSRVHRLSLLLAGRVLIERTLGGLRYHRWADAGSVNVVPAGVAMACSVKGRADFMVVYLDPELVNEVAAEVLNLKPASIQFVESLAVRDDVLEQSGRLLLAEATRGDSIGTRISAATIARMLAIGLVRACSANGGRAAVQSSPLVGWRLRRAIEFMHANLAEDVPLSRLAATAELSSSHFTRAFRQATGESPHQYLVRLRVEKAQELLEQTRLSVIQIGLSCGFEQPNHFSSTFRKATGLSPRAYRNARSMAPRDQVSVLKGDRSATRDTKSMSRADLMLL